MTQVFFSIFFYFFQFFYNVFGIDGPQQMKDLSTSFLTRCCVCHAMHVKQRLPAAQEHRIGRLSKQLLLGATQAAAIAK